MTQLSICFPRNSATVEIRRWSDSLSASLSALEPYRHKLGLTRDAMKYSLYASRGFSNEQIAEICNTSVNSVKSSLKRTYSKLGVTSRSKLKSALSELT